MTYPAGDWDRVHGQLIAFADPLHALPPIDRLENFHSHSASLYHRVLLPVQMDDASRLAWTYTMTECEGGYRLQKGI